MAGILDYTPALNANLNVDDTGNTFAGTLAGKYKVYIDPFAANNDANQYYVVGYKGTNPYDAGMFYCPYVPLQMVRAVGQDTFHQRSRTRLVMESLLTHSLRVTFPTRVSEDFLLTPTVTTEESRFKTSCDSFHNFIQDSLRGVFFFTFPK